MSIVKKAGPSSLPLTSADYVGQNLLQTQDKLNLEQPIRISSTNVLQGALFQIGETYYYAESATAISGTPSDYVKITPSVDTLTATASFVANLTGVTWNASYGGYYDVSGNLYVFDEAKALQATAISTIMTRYVQQSSAGDVFIGRDLDVGGVIINSIGNVTIDDDLDVTGDSNLGNGASDSTVVTGTLNLDSSNNTGIDLHARRFDSTDTEGDVCSWVASVLGTPGSSSYGIIGRFGATGLNSMAFGSTGNVSVSLSGSPVKSFSNGSAIAIGSDFDIFFAYNP